MTAYAGSSVLVTGGQGFIGAWLAERLLDEGARVVVPRRDVEPDSRFVTEGVEQRCAIAFCDLSDHEAILRVLNEHEVRTVFHLAAQTIVGTARRSPLSTFEANVRGTYNLLEACRELGTVERVVVASSDKAYGAQDELPYREDSPLLAVHPYDVSKASADLIARSYAVSYGLPVAVTRLANVYGPGDLNWSRIVPDTARALTRGERPVVRSDGTPARDYLYVEDAVEAYLAVAGSLDRGDLAGRAWNAGRGEPIAVLELVRRLIEVSGRELEPDVRGQGTPAGEIDRQWLDSSAIRLELGWEPRVELHEGLRRSWEWYRQLG
ncbi:MAG: GDP-mannose 4,6-dehydratase [Thermoleophilaceae bacterium]